MGKLYDLKEAIATRLKADVTELADVEVIAHHGRDVSNKLRQAINKAAGLCVIVDLTNGDNILVGQRSMVELRLSVTVSVTIWAIPTHLTHVRYDDLETIASGDPIVDTPDEGQVMRATVDPVAPLTSGPRNPDDVLEAVAKYLQGLNPLVAPPDPNGCWHDGRIEVTRWGLINAEPPFLVHEIQGTIISQLET